MRRKQVGLVVLVVLSVAGAAGAQGQGLSPELNAQVASLKSAAPPGLDSRLVQIVQRLGTLPEDLLASQAPVSQGITVAVTVRFAGGAGSLPAYLASMGASVATLSADAVADGASARPKRWRTTPAVPSGLLSSITSTS